MHDYTDPLPSPFGDVTARWLRLADEERDRHAVRLLGVPYAEEAIGRTTAATADQYRRLVDHGAAGDSIAFAWLAVRHTSLLINRGRVLMERDPSEWGAVSLGLLHDTLRTVDRSDERWLRRRVYLRLSLGMARAVRRTLTREQHERATDPDRLRATVSAVDPAVDRTRQLDLSIELDRALARLDAPTREAFLALADRRPLREVAVRHHLTTAAVKRRVVRARPRLQRHLAGYHRTTA